MRNHNRLRFHNNPNLPNEKIPLTQLQSGEIGIVAGISGGHSLMSRMVSFGFTPGVEVTLLQNVGHGPLIACVRGVHVALGRCEAGNIIVQRQAL